MSQHSFSVAVGDQVYVGEGTEEVGAIRKVASDHIVVYIENSGEFRIAAGPVVKAAHDGKLILDAALLEPDLAQAIAKAHEGETE